MPVAVERVADLLESVVPGLAVFVRVDLQRDSQPRVAKDDLCVPSRDAKILQQSCCGVPQMVQRDNPELVVVADAAEGPDKVARLNRPSCPGGEDQAVVSLPGSPEDLALRFLRRPVEYSSAAECAVPGVGAAHPPEDISGRAS